MSSNFPGRDFHLPGLYRGSPMERQLTTAITGAYSIIYNPRRLEYPFYGVWNIILTAMVSDLGQNVYVVPQYAFDGVVPASTEEDLAISMTNAYAKELIPDFVLVVDKIKNRSPYTIPRWRRITVVSRQFLILVEGKRSPSRRPGSRESFEEDLIKLLNEAQMDLKKQSSKMFEGHPNVQQVILVAFSGIWWSWMIYTRELYQATASPLDQPGEDSYASTSLGDEEEGSEYAPTEDETPREKKKRRKKLGERRAVAESKTPLSSSSPWPGNSAHLALGAGSSRQPTAQADTRHGSGDSDSIDGEGLNPRRTSNKTDPKGKGKQPERGVGKAPATLDPSSSHVPSRPVFLADATSGPSHEATANIQAEGGIEPSGATQLRRSSRSRRPTERYEPPPVRLLQRPVTQKPKTKSAIRYYHHLELMEELHEGVEHAVQVFTGTFSQPILLGSSVSNQALYIIHGWLKNEIDNSTAHQGEANEERTERDDGNLTESDFVDGSDSNTGDENESASETESADGSEVGPQDSEEETADGDPSWDYLTDASE